MDTDLVEDVIVHGKLKAPLAKRMAGNGCSFKV
jgi:hypothetical protein